MVLPMMNFKDSLLAGCWWFSFVVCDFDWVLVSFPFPWGWWIVTGLISLCTLVRFV
jgi:hypothetical protein